MENNAYDELPIGFSMALSMNDKAMKFFSNLDRETKIGIIKYIKTNSTGYEAKEKINKIINCLEQNNLNFYK